MRVSWKENHSYNWLNTIVYAGFSCIIIMVSSFQFDMSTFQEVLRGTLVHLYMPSISKSKINQVSLVIFPWDVDKSIETIWCKFRCNYLFCFHIFYTFQK